MGIETPISLFSAVLHNRTSGGRDQAVHAVMVLRTTRDFKAGEVLRMGGHQHAIEGGEALLLPAGSETQNKAPFYLAANNRLRCDVQAGSVVSVDMLDLKGSVLFDTWKKQLG
jgi:predicted homoserine dehydrogenase-like protein